MSEPVLSLRGVARAYRTGEGVLEVLRDVELDVFPGEVVGLIGPSGSGKSSLLHAAGLLEHPDAGQIIVEGRDCSELGERLHHQPAQMSGGEQQRVAIARALANGPRVVLADEPTGNLDPDLSLEIMNLFREINSRGTTVVVATHDRELIRRVGRRAITLDHGRVVEGG